MEATNKEFTDEQRAIIDKVEKLLRLAGKNPNEAEAASATNKAQELLLQYNLDMGAVGQSDTGARADEKLQGGFYKFERDLWSSVARLNFCWHWSQTELYRINDPDNRKKNDKGKGWLNVQRLVGRKVNILVTKNMVNYLMQVIERLTKERLKDNEQHSRSRWAVSFRQGMAQRLIEKINDRRWEQYDAERKKAAEDAARAAAAGMAGASSGTALTIAQLRDIEEQGNYDLLNGEGAWARMQARVAERAAAAAKARAEADAEYTAWAAAHPEEAMKAEQQRLKEARKREQREARRSPRSYRQPAFKGDYGAFKSGYEAAENVGIDIQAEGRKSAGALTHG